MIHPIITLRGIRIQLGIKNVYKPIMVLGEINAPIWFRLFFFSSDWEISLDYRLAFHHRITLPNV